MDTTTPAPPTQAQKLLAEAIGTFVLVVVGVGSAVIGRGDITSIGLSFGIAIVAMVYAFGRVSGGHFNPAVSVGAAIGGRISWREAGLYSAAQVVGGLVGGIVLVIIAIAGDTGYEFGDDALGANGFGDRGGLDLAGALIIEIVLTFIFLTVILSVTDERNEHPALAPLAIGLTLAAVHFVGISATGTSVNPARSISVVFFSGSDAIVQIWLFILGPLLGGALAGLAYPAIFGHASEPVAGSGFNFAGKPGAVPGYGAPDQYQQQWNQPGNQPVAPVAGGYQQPAASSYAPPAATAAVPQPQVEQPIIQDGWQWDPQAQQWIPAQQQAPQGGWQAPGSEQTQVRPTDGA